MKLSVITTFFNSADYISQCLESVQEINTHFDYEHILVNDGSSDETIDLISNPKLRNIKVVGKDHIGRGPALNLGLKNASGDYICILDSDDIINPLWINFFLNHYSEYEHAGVYCGLVTTDFNAFKSYDPPTKVSQNILSPTRLLFYNPICHSGTIFKKSSVDQIKGYSLSLKSQFDWDLWLRLSFKNENFICLKYLAAYKRIHENQSFESKQHFVYTIRGIALQLKSTFKSKPIYFLPVFLFSLARMIWSVFPKRLRTFKYLDMLR